MTLVALKPLLIAFDGATTAYVLGQGHAKCQYKKYLQYNNKPFGEVKQWIFLVAVERVWWWLEGMVGTK